MDGGAARVGGRLLCPPRTGRPRQSAPVCAGKQQLLQPVNDAKALEENGGWSSADKCFVSDSKTSWKRKKKK